MEIAILFALICLNGVFAMSEIALVTARKARLQKLIDEGDSGAAAAVKLGEDPTRFLSTIQIGITSIGVLNGIVGEAALAQPLSLWLVELGMEQVYDRQLTDPASRGAPAVLSLDMRVQGALEDELERGIRETEAIGAAGIVRPTWPAMTPVKTASTCAAICCGFTACPQSVAATMRWNACFIGRIFSTRLSLGAAVMRSTMWSNISGPGFSW